MYTGLTSKRPKLPSLQQAKPTTFTVAEVFASALTGVKFDKKEDTDEGYSIYTTRVGDMVSNDQHRYIILVTSKCGQPSMQWGDCQVLSVQMRTLPSYFSNCSQCRRVLRWDGAHTVSLALAARTVEATTYHTPELEQVLVYHSPNKKAMDGSVSLYQYPSKYNLGAAIETWCCVVSLVTTATTTEPQQETKDVDGEYEYL